MSETAENLLKKALTLDEKDRASIAGALIESLHGEPEADVEEAWEAEIKRRVAELDARSEKTVPWSVAKAMRSRNNPLGIASCTLNGRLPCPPKVRDRPAATVACS